LNGAAARQVAVGDKVIIIAYAQMSKEEAQALVPAVVLVDGQNKVAGSPVREEYGQLA
jgi:aspartate 1-decarboxylase